MTTVPLFVHSPIIFWGLLLTSGILAAGCGWLWWQWRLSCAARDQLLPVAARNQAIVDGGGEGVFELDEAGAICYANPAAQRISGYDLSELQGRQYRALLSAPTAWQARDTARIGYTTDMLSGVGAVVNCKDGRKRPVEYRMLPLTTLIAIGRASRTAASRSRSLLVFRDLTDRSRLDVMLADMQHVAKVGAWELNVGSWRLSVSEGISRRLNLSARRSVHAKRLLLGFTSEARAQLFAAMHMAVEHGQSFDLELRMHAAGRSGTHQVEWLRIIGRPERLDGITLRLYGAVQDVTDRKRAEQRVQQTSEFFGSTLDALPASVIYLDQLEQVQYCNSVPLSNWLGLPVAGAVDVLSQVMPGHYPELASGIHQALQGRASQIVRTFTHTEDVRQIQCNFVPQVSMADHPAGCWLVLSDVTELKTLEVRMYQAEKMHAVGLLTGGLAHDFNNLLGVILGNLQLLERDVPDDESVQRKLAAAMRAALRGSDLTRRLLAFARRRPVEARNVNLNEELLVLSELLRQTLGEQVELKLQLDPECWQLKIDLGQLEDALLNMAINARDAMPEGGVLTVSAHNVVSDAAFFREHPDLSPGEYVEICVADTGHGIPPQLINRIFEPFFTTKEIGKGSGLGLAMVHGFVKQLGGTVSVRSELTRGTTICLFLPRWGVGNPVEPALPSVPVITGGHETILVVEDDTDLRATTTLALQDMGYRVLEASTGEAALNLIRQGHHIDALFTDVIIPAGMLGTELAVQARQLDPHIRVLLTTGYLDDPAITETGRLNNDPVLPKPYVNQVLAQRIRELLD